MPRSRQRAAVILAALAVAFGLPARDGRAAQPASLTLRLARQPVWHEPGDPLALHVAVTNEGSTSIKGFGIRVGVSDRVRTRSDLHLSFDGAGLELSTLPKIYENVTIAPHERRVISIQDPVESLELLEGATEGGVYPLTLTLYSTSTDEILDSVISSLIYYPQRPERPLLNIVPVLPLNQMPAVGPDGTLLEPYAGPGLEEALATGGWLEGWLGALERVTAPPPPAEEPRRRPRPRRGKGRRGRAERVRPRPPGPLHLAFAPSPRLLQELALMADGYRRSDGSEVERDSRPARLAARSLGRLRAVSGRPTTQPLLVPYAFPDLPTSAAELAPEQNVEQLAEGAAVTRELLGVDVANSWLLPPWGRLDSPSLEQLQRSGYGRRIAFLSSEAVEPAQDPALAGCPDPAFSFTCPVKLETAYGAATGLTSDERLEKTLEDLTQAGTDKRLALQRFFAETSMIREELPGREGRVIQVTFPSDWQPAPRQSRLLLRGLQRAPWLTSRTPTEAVRSSAKVVRRAIVDTAPRLATNLEPFFYTDRLADAQRVVDSYGKTVGRQGERLRRLQHNLLVATSRTLWPEPEVAYLFVDRTEEEILNELAKIKVVGVDDVTLTSSRGKFQIVLANETGYPVTIDIDLIAPQLTFDEDSMEKLSSTYGPGNHPLTVQARARSSGKFQLAVQVETSDGFPITQKNIEIRSTVFNRIALTITFGALAFLILFSLSRGLQKRRRPPAAGAGPAVP